MSDQPGELLPLSELKPDPKNARKHNRRNLEMLRRSLQEVGFARSIAIDEDNNLLAGSGTITAAAGLLDNVRIIDIKGDEVVALRRLDLTPEQKEHYKILDNRIAELAEWDSERIADLLADEPAFTHELFTPEELEALIGKMETGESEGEKVDVDKAAEYAEKWGTAAGQVWEIPSIQTPGRAHRAACGDSTNPEHVKALLGPYEPRIMVTDPPYGVEYDPGWRNGITGEFGDFERYSTGVENDDRADWAEAWALSPAKVAYVWHAGVFAAQVQTSLEAEGFEVRNQIVWVKQHYAVSRGAYHWLHEPCWYAVKKGNAADWLGGRKQTTVWEIASLNAAGKKEERLAHGTQKPVECMARPIRNHAGDVYDPFVGSGTTLEAAEKEGRIAFVMDISPNFLAVTLERAERIGLSPKLITDSA